MFMYWYRRLQWQLLPFYLLLVSTSRCFSQCFYLFLNQSSSLSDVGHHDINITYNSTLVLMEKVTLFMYLILPKRFGKLVIFGTRAISNSLDQTLVLGYVFSSLFSREAGFLTWEPAIVKILSCVKSCFIMCWVYQLIDLSHVDQLRWVLIWLPIQYFWQNEELFL